MHNIRKLGLGIVAFEGVEHLKNIIYEIRDLVDVIVVCLQHYSYYNNPIDINDVNIVRKLKRLGYIDHIIWFEPKNFYKDRCDAPRYIETNKRNFILNYLEHDMKCSHSLVIDSDEFYIRDEFKRAKEIINNDPSLEVNYCEYINYYRDYKHIIEPPYKFIKYVPFITKSSYRFDFEKGTFNRTSDPTRRYVYPINIKCNVFENKIIKMHHLSWIRLKIEKKIDNWSSLNTFKKYDNLREKILKKYYNKDSNQFNKIIPFESQYAITFSVNTNNQLNLIKVKQEIFPHFKLEEEPTKYLK